MAGAIPYTEIKDFLQGYFAGIYPVLDFDEVERLVGPDAGVSVEQSEESFLALEEILADEEVVGMGDSTQACVRESGAMIVHCFAPSPHASNASREIADRVREALWSRNINGVRIIELGAPDPGVTMNSGLWGAAALSFSYQWDTHRARPT